MLTAFVCLLSVHPAALSLSASHQAIDIRVTSTSPANDQTERLAGELNAEAQQWAARYLELHKVPGEMLKVQVDIRMPFELPNGLSPREVQFRKSDYLEAKVKVAGDNETAKAVSFSLAYRDGEWTHDARYRKSNPMSAVLKAYVRKAVDKGLDIALSH